MRWAAGTALVLVAALSPSAAGQGSSRTVAVFDADGVEAPALASALETIGRAPDLRAVAVGPEDVRGGALEHADAVLFTGGRGSVQGRMLGDEGRARVRAFVRRGGGYVGICAGSFMALQGRAEFHKLAIVAGRHSTGDAWVRGVAPLAVRTDGGRSLRLHYANGPLIAAEEVEGIDAPVVLARFEEEVHRPERGTHPGEMIGMPAIVASRYGDGRIVLFSPNPTLDPARPELLLRALRFVSGPEARGAPWTFELVLGERR